MSTRRDNLLQALAQIQQHRSHRHHDILAVAASMTEPELERHIEVGMARVAHWSNHGGNARLMANAARRPRRAA